MINVSNQLLKESEDNQGYYVTANVTLSDGTKLTLNKEDFYLDGNGIVDSADSSSFPIGVAIEKTATLSLVNDENQFSGYSFNRAVFVIYMNLELSDGKIETFKRGSFIVCKKPTIDEEIDLTLLDYMSKTDRSYDTNLIFPCTAGELLRDSCQTCGIVVGDASFTDDDFQIMKKPTSTTHRAVIGMIAALAGGNARIDENDLLRIVSYPKIDKNNFTGIKLYSVDDVQTDTDIITVTGIKYTSEEQDYIYGSNDYMITLKGNQLLSGNEANGVKRIGKLLIGFQLLPFSLSSIPVGYITFGDAIRFEDYRGNVYWSYATDIEFLFADSTNISCKAKSVEEQETEYPNENRVLVEQAKEEVHQRMSGYDVKLKQMNNLAANTLGFYYTEEIQDDGSIISYRHNKPTLEESKIIYKTTADGFFLSIDGGNTWKAGFDSNGDAVLNILYAIGIRAEWINTRGLKAEDNDGNVTFEIDAVTGEFNANITNLLIKGKDFSSISKDQLDDFINNTYLSDILGIKSRLDGKIETWYQDKDPSLEWTRITETPWLDSNGEKILDSNGNEIILFWESEKAEHEGDLWYNTADNSQWTYISGEWKPYSIPDELLDKIDGKCTVYMQQPKPPYNSGDLWVITDEKGKTSLKTSVVNRVDGDFVQEDWIDFKYVDADDVADAIKKYDTSLGQPEIFNKLTNGGKEQGIYIKDGKLYINATYILSGTLAGNLINGRGLKVIDDDKKVTLEIDSKGNVSLAVTNFSLKGKSVEDIASEEARKKIEELPRETENLLKGYGLAEEDVTKYWDITGTPAYSQTDPVRQSQALQLSDLSAGDVFFSSKVTENPISTVSGRYNISFWLKGEGTVFTDYIYAEVEVYFNGALIDTAKVQYWKKYSYSIDVSKMNSGFAKLQFKIKGFSNIKHNICIYRPQVTFGYTSLDIFNMLTNNGALQAVYMIGGKLMLNGEYIKALSVAAEALAANSVTTEKLLAGAVTAEKITIRELSALGASLSGFKMDSKKIYIYSEEQGKSTSLVISRVTGNTEKPFISFGMGRNSASARLKLSADGIRGARTNALALQDDTSLASDTWTSDTHHSLGKTEFYGDVTVHADFKVTGTKSVVAKTQNYGSQAFYCYETPTPTLGDFGGGVIGEDGLAVILIDDIFRECTDTEIEYYVFLQREGAGEAWVSEKTDTYFSVCGTPGLHFAWELKARQLNKEYIRFNAGKEDREVDFKTVDLEKAMFAEREKIIMEMEGELA
nr:hypothetical protein [uncultured Blautia sp.]